MYDSYSCILGKDLIENLKKVQENHQLIVPSIQWCLSMKSKIAMMLLKVKTKLLIPRLLCSVRSHHINRLHVLPRLQRSKLKSGVNAWVELYQLIIFDSYTDGVLCKKRNSGDISLCMKFWDSALLGNKRCVHFLGRWMNTPPCFFHYYSKREYHIYLAIRWVSSVCFPGQKNLS